MSVPEEENDVIALAAGEGELSRFTKSLVVHMRICDLSQSGQYWTIRIRSRVRSFMSSIKTSDGFYQTSLALSRLHQSLPFFLKRSVI
jgi:hypothetical protein